MKTLALIIEARITEAEFSAFKRHDRKIQRLDSPVLEMEFSGSSRPRPFFVVGGAVLEEAPDFASAVDTVRSTKISDRGRAAEPINRGNLNR